MTGQDELTGRVRDGLPGAEAKRMFGGTSFLVDGRIVATVRHDGDLMVRVDPDRGPALASEPGARPAAMGERLMGPDWIQVSPEAVASPERLRFWLDLALAQRTAGGA